MKTLEKLFVMSTHCIRQHNYHFCQLETAKQMFLKDLHIIPPTLAAMFSHNTSGYDMLFCKCSKNVLDFLEHF